MEAIIIDPTNPATLNNFMQRFNTTVEQVPEIKTYNQVKAKYPKALVLVHIGDFYETYYDDAILLANTLGTVLSKRNYAAFVDVSLSGFPQSDLETNLRKLTAAGIQAAIVDLDLHNTQPTPKIITPTEPMAENSTQQPDVDKSGVFDKSKFTFYSDGAHGWLRVPISLINELGIAGQISQYSYQDSEAFPEYAYLEEDLDAGIFIKAADKKYPIAVGQWKESESNGESFVRRLPHYHNPTTPPNMFVNGNWFAQNPAKILGEAYTASGRWGNVTKYKGNIAAIEQIDAPLDAIYANQQKNNPLLSSGSGKIPAIEAIMPTNEAFIANVIETSKATVAKKRAKKETEPVQTQAEPLDIRTFEEIFTEQNAHIPTNDIRAFLYWKTQLKKPYSRYWNKMVSPADTYSQYSPLELQETEEYHLTPGEVTDLVEKGHLFYFNGIYEPRCIFASGDMYAKKSQLERDQATIEKLYSPSVYQQHIDVIQEAFSLKYKQRLVISGDNNSLVIVPHSEFAKKFTVERLVFMEEDDKFEVPSWSGTASNIPWTYVLNGYRGSQTHIFNEFNLYNAFLFWLCKADPRPELKSTVSYYDIVNIYFLQEYPRIERQGVDKATQKAEEAKLEKIKDLCKKEAERLFAQFLDTQLLPNDKVRLETTWNMDFNNYLDIDYYNVPVAWTMCRNVKGNPEVIRPEKREAVAFINAMGAGCLAYDVGVGKTPSACFIISSFLDSGQCKRPYIVVPNQVYKQFISEIKTFTPHLKINEGYNLSPKYAQNFMNAEGQIVPVQAGSITVFTYEGLERIGFSDATSDKLFSALYDILDQGGESLRKASKKDKSTNFMARIETLIGRGMAGTMFNIEDFGFDYGCYDEAHKMKKVFTAVKGNTEDRKNPYQFSSGTPSSIGLKGFMLNYYLLSQNNWQNILLLTATPFTNSPLEIFSMLAMISYEALKLSNLGNLVNFFDTFVQTSTELVINAKMQPQQKQVILGFNNLVSLQSFIFRYINKKDAVNMPELNSKRPQKYILPYNKKIEGDTVVALSDAEKVETYIEMNTDQKNIMDNIVQFVEGKLSEQDLMADFAFGEEEGEEGSAAKESEFLNLEKMGEEEKAGVRMLRGLNFMRNLAISPYVFKKSVKPTYLQYVQDSPKLLYIMRCIETVRNYHISKNEPVSGQVIYMDRAVEYFPLLKEYLIKEVGFAPHEVGIIQSGLPKDGSRSKEYVKNLFNGEIYNAETGMYDPVPHERRIKIVIGSSTIKEGINLQKYGTVLYNAAIDWNPTDMQQLEGRVYRQGNTFGAVRICIPLVVDSADIFLFQKLQEKTSRLNNLWARNGKNTLDIDELNPEEIKYAMIRNPATIEEMQRDEFKAKLESEKVIFERNIETAKNYLNKAGQLLYENNKLVEYINQYLPQPLKTNGGNELQRGQQIKKAWDDLLKSKTDPKNGLPWARDYWERRETPELKDKNGNVIPESEEEKPDKPSIYGQFALHIRDLDKADGSFLRPNKLQWDYKNSGVIDAFIEDLTAQMGAIDAQKEALSNPENVQSRIDAIIADRKEKQIYAKTLGQNISDFTRLNYLLSVKKADMPPPAALPATVQHASPAPAPAPAPVASDKEYLTQKVSDLELLLSLITDEAEHQYVSNTIADINFLLQIAA
jgi:hypothetical protein